MYGAEAIVRSEDERKRCSSVTITNPAAGFGRRVPRRLAAAERPGPEDRVGRALSSGNTGLSGRTCSREAKLTTTSQHTPELAEGRCRVVDAAQNPHQHRRIERAVLRRQLLGGALDDVYRDCGAALAGRRRAYRAVGLDGEQALNTRRVVLDERPSPAPTSSTFPRSLRADAAAALPPPDPYVVARAAPGSAPNATAAGRRAAASSPPPAKWRCARSTRPGSRRDRGRSR